MSAPTDLTHWTPGQSVAWLGQEVTDGDPEWKGMCLALTANSYGFGGSGVNSAIDYWHGSWHTHPGDRNVPAGGLACFSGGKYGHIMVSVGDGRFASNDIRRTGRVDYCTIADIERAWGQTYLGWAEPCYWNGWGTNPETPPTPAEEDDMTPAQAAQLEDCQHQANAANAQSAQVLAEFRDFRAQRDGWQATTLEREGVGPAYFQDWLADTRIIAESAHQQAATAAALAQQILDRLDA